MSFITWFPTRTCLISVQVQKGPMDIFVQTIRKEGFFALYKGKLALPP